MTKEDLLRVQKLLLRFVALGFGVSPFVIYDPRFNRVVMDGSFTPEQLQGIIDAVKEYHAEPDPPNTDKDA